MPRTITVKSWSELVKLSDDFPMHFFRGQGDSKWVLECSLHRTLEANYLSENCDVTEYYLMREFRRGAKRYITAAPPDDDYVAWLSLMQHHGTPTRLIDFTHSFYVAVYFALIGTVGESALWVIDPEFLFQAANIPRNRGANDVPAEWEYHANRQANVFLAGRLGSALCAAEESQDLGVIPVEPIEQHQRLAIQQGLFLMPLNSFKTVEENLHPYLKRRQQPVLKIIIPQLVRFDGLRHLKNMNITAETLFPGIDGFAKSLVHTQTI